MIGGEWLGDDVQHSLAMEWLGYLTGNERAGKWDDYVNKGCETE